MLRWGVSPHLGLSDAAASIVPLLVGLVTFAQWLALLLLTAALLAHHCAYRSRLNASTLDLLPTLLASPIVAAAVLAVGSGLLRPDLRNGREVAIAGSLFAALLVAGRVVCTTVIRRARRCGFVAHRTLVIGAGEVSREITLGLLEHRDYGLLPVGVWDYDPMLGSDMFGGVPLLRDTPDLAQLIRELSAKVVIIAFGRHREADMVRVIQTCDRMDCEIFVVPRLFELHQRDADMEELWGLPLARLRRPAFRSPTWRLKRLLDVLVAAAILVGMAPLLALVALAVRIDGGPGIIFRQERVGLDGRTFELLKFRSVRAATEPESRSTWSVAGDSRVGPIGRFMRRTSLDELPQLWNVLRGDMTLVGPRPERPYYVTQFAKQFPRYLARHRVPAGLTGWAQVHGLRGDTSIAERAVFDNFYIQNWSLWLDVRILLLTVLAVLRREGR